MKKLRDFLLNTFAKYIPDIPYIKLVYFLKHRKRLNLTRPKYFTEKLQWLKVNDRSDLHTICADKYEVRDYVKNIIGEQYLIPFIALYDHASDIDLKKLPMSFVMKGTHGSGMNHVVFNKQQASEKEIVKDFEFWEKCNQFWHSREWQYKNIKPRIIVEQLLLDDDGQVPADIKIHCFRGVNSELKQIVQLDSGRFTNHKQDYFDESWSRLDLTFSNENFSAAESEKIPPKPDNLELLLSLADKLSAPFCYLRVDFYTLKGKIYFGELTFHHHSGLTVLNADWDEKLGKMIHLTPTKDY